MNSPALDNSPKYSPTDGDGRSDPVNTPEDPNFGTYYGMPYELPTDPYRVNPEYLNRPERFPQRSDNQQSPRPTPSPERYAVRRRSDQSARDAQGTPPVTPPIAPTPIQPPHAPDPERIIPRRPVSRGRGQQARVPSLTLPSRSSSQAGRGQTSRYDDYIRSDQLDNDDAFLGAVLLPEEPSSYKEAMSFPASLKWEEAMKEEMDSLKHNGTWELMDLPAGRKAVRCKWVYRLKFNAAGEPYRYKARLVAKGFTQVYGLDYDETFSPVARLDTMRSLLALATLEDWEIHQVDVKSAFLKGDLDKEIYMQQPEGFQVVGQEKKVCHLLKAIYGLKQASRQWHRKLRSALLDMGFTQLSADTSVYVYRHQGGITILMVYVDDITIMGNDAAHLISVKQELAKRFDLTDLGELDYFLGIRVTRDRKHRILELDQSKYIRDVLIRFQMIDVTPAFTPLAAGTQLIKSSHPVEDNDQAFITQYQSLVGSLMYAMLGTRPDLSFAVTKLSQFGSNPTEYHLKAAKHVLRYLSATQNNRLQFGSIDDNEITGYSDSDWAADQNDRHSTTGYTFLYAGGSICWASRKQPTVALSSTEAEYMAISDASRHAIWLRTLFTELGFKQPNPLPIHVDNKGSVDLALNPVHHKRTKHIDIKHHFIRQCLEDLSVGLVQIPTNENFADVLTKSLPFAKHSLFSGKLGVLTKD